MFTPLKGRSQGNSLDEHGEQQHAAAPAPEAPAGLTLQSSIPKRVSCTSPASDERHAKPHCIMLCD